MPIETATFIEDLVVTNPDGSVDTKSTLDNHDRLIKSTLKATFVGFAGRFRRIQTKSAAYTAVLNDNGSILRTSGTWTLTGTAAATLGNGWEILVYNDGAGTITFDPNAAETVNGAATLVIAANTFSWISCNGALFLATIAPINLVNVATTDTAQTITATKTLQSSDAGAAAGPTIPLDRNSASPAVSDILGAIPFNGRDSGAGTDTYAQIQAEIVDPTAASEDGELAFLTAVAGALAKRGFIRNGLVWGSATGGDQGAGTVNAVGVYDDGSLVYSANNRVPQAGLNTTQSEVSTTLAQQLLALPGGEYGFYPRTKMNGIAADTGISTIGGGGLDASGAADLVTQAEYGSVYVTLIVLGAAGGGSRAMFAQQRHIQASPPWESFRGGDAVPRFVFGLLNVSTGRVDSGYDSDDPPWGNNGPTIVNPLGRLQALLRLRVTITAAQAAAVPVLRAQYEQELSDQWDFIHDPVNANAVQQEMARRFTQAEKNADMALIPHPFLGFNPATHRVIVLNPTDDKFCRGLAMRHLMGDSVLECLHAGHFAIDNTPLPGLVTPPGVMAVRARWKLT